MFAGLNDFIRDEDGAVAVDWVVLTAGVVALNVAVLVNMIEGGLEVNATLIAEKIGESHAGLGSGTTVEPD